jgi:chaperonin GroES
MSIETTIAIEKLVASHNIAELLEDSELSYIGSKVFKDFEVDLQSREGWEKRNEEAMKLALQLKEEKSFPWQGASNVKFPLITIAALQYHARAYPTLLGTDTPVHCKVTGEDPDGLLAARATRIENHMSYQVMEEDEAWESETDKVLITQPILGCAFKKTYFNPIKKHNISEYILAKDLVVNYWTKSLETAPRITHILYMSENDIYERVARGLWLDITNTKPASKDNTLLSDAKDKSQGLTAPQTQDDSTPYEILEQHCFFDFDGDGYKEPYIVYVRRDTKQVLRIVARFFPEGIEKKGKKILSIQAEQYFVKFPFIPSPDGGFYDLGFGVLLGPLNESINTLVNQLIDAGTMSNTAGGFLSRGIKMRGGNYSFAPLEWKHVESTGDDLRKGIMPLPTREPSQVLFTLLNLLINYGERIGGSVDVLSGINPGQNTPAETSRNSVEQGMKIFSGIFKRTYRALRDEFRLLYRLNQLYIQNTVYFSDAADGTGQVLAEDYVGSASTIRPSADPHIVSDSQRIQQASAVKQASATSALYDKYETEKLYLKALKVSNIDKILPDPKGPNALPPPQDPKLAIEQAKSQASMQELQMKLKFEALKLMEEARVNQAKITQLQAQAALAYEQAKGVTTGHEIAMLDAQIGAAKTQHDAMIRQIETMMKLSEQGKQEGQQASPSQAVPQ